LKRYRTERGTEVVQALFSEKQEAETLVTSHFTTLEVESAAARALKGRVLTRRAYGVLLSLFAEDLAENVVLLPVLTGFISDATDVARRYAVRAGDAIHIASALRVGQSVDQDVVVVAADKLLLQAADETGLDTLNPEADGALEKLRAWSSSFGTTVESGPWPPSKPSLAWELCARLHPTVASGAVEIF
jgi:predicted nucleic acid-binding protein